MKNESRVEKLKAQLAQLQALKNSGEEIKLTEASNQVIQQTPVKTLGTHPGSGKYGKSLENEERGFSNLVILTIILMLFQIGFIATLYFLFK